MTRKEKILSSNDKRFVMFPIEDEDIWNMYKKSTDCFWRTEEIDLTKDLDFWKNLNEDEQFYI